MVCQGRLGQISVLCYVTFMKNGICRKNSESHPAFKSNLKKLDIAKYQSKLYRNNIYGVGCIK